MDTNYFPRSPSRASFRSISTAYLGPTNYRGARVRVWAGDDRRRGITLAWDYALDSERNQIRAVAAMIARLGWHGAWTIGGLEPGLVAACAIRYYPPAPGSDLSRREECAAVLRACVDLAKGSDSVILVLDPDTMRGVTGEGEVAS